jgi:predicted Fe-Mo cluster-binding NifX family protein
MKIAIVTDDGKTISAHFGRARYYTVLTIEDGRVVGQEMREKHAHQGHHGSHGEHAGAAGQGGAGISFQEPPQTPFTDTHTAMLEPIQDCQIAVARGMGNGMFQRLHEAGIDPVLTDARDVEEVARLHLRGELVHRPERLH